MLNAFKEKYKPIHVTCSEAEKDDLIKNLGKTPIQFALNRRSQTEHDKYTVVYIPQMTLADRKKLKKLQGINPATARKLLTWNMLNVRNKHMLKELGSVQSNIPKKTIKFSGDYELELYDMTDRDDFVWLVHTEPSDAVNLKLVSAELQGGTLWNKLPFISCCLQDAYTRSYAGSQSIVHSLKAFPISLILEVDPNAIISTDPFDARSPEGSDRTKHLQYVHSKLVERLEKDQKFNFTPTGTVEDLQSVQDKGLLSTNELLNKTSGFNEVTIITGELAKDWGIKPPTIKGIVIEKNQLHEYLSTQDRMDSNYISIIRESLAQIINLAKSANLPVILIDPKPQLKTLRAQASDVDNTYERGTDERGNYFKKEIEHHISEFKHKLSNTPLSSINKEWYQKMLAFLQKVKIHYLGVDLPAIHSIEEQVLLNIILADAQLDANFSDNLFYEKRNQEMATAPQKVRQDFMLWASRLAQEKRHAQDALNKAKKELKFHHPDLNFDVEALNKCLKN